MYKQLTSEQRYTISVLLQNGMKQKDIAKAINVSPSTVSREIRRNSGIRGHYNWETAQANAVRTKRKKPGNRSVDKDVMRPLQNLTHSLSFLFLSTIGSPAVYIFDF